MKIKRRGTEVELIRNKRRGLKLKIMETTGQACKNCLLCKNTTGICGVEEEKNLNPCDKLGLDMRYYFVHEG